MSDPVVSSILHEVLSSATSPASPRPTTPLTKDGFEPRTDGGYVDVEIAFWVDSVGVRSAAVLGIVGNVISFWVWSAENSYNATTFLFKYLAILDTVFLAVASAKGFYEQIDEPWVEFFRQTIYLSQLLSVHTTLLVAVSRWMAVSYPLHVHRLLSPRRIYGACLALFVWCLLLQAVEFVRLEYGQYFGFSSSTDSAIFVTKRIVGLVLPLLVLLCLSVSLVWKTHRRMKKFGFSGDSNGVKEGNNHSTQHHQPTGDRGTRRLTLAVVCISVSCFLAYPVGISMKIVANLNPVTDASACGVVCYTAVVFAAFLCQVINSGINVIFYWAFASRFRELFKVRVARLSCRRRPRRLADRRRNTAVMYVSN